MSLQEFCIPYFSQPLLLEGATVATMIGTNNPLLCETGYFIETNGFYNCMKPPVSITSTKDEFLPGDECFFKAYLNINSVYSESVQFTTAKCGFNVGKMAYCDQHKGD